GALVGGKSPGPSGIGGAGAGAAGLTAPRLGARRSSSGDANVPQMFQLRKSRNKAGIVAGQGGSADTEKAVKAALQWLATHQDADGRWDASQFEAGKERKVLGQDRAGAGAEADTGVSGLALLAFLGAGHTHLEGEYAQVVENGLSFLLASQHPDDGHIGGAAEHFAFMYCHGMATLALGEAYAMTHDERLLEPLRHAVNYTVRSQVAKSGSWRYLPGDAYGDTSQLGWQLMALKSAEQAGMEIPRRTQEGMVKFLKAVSTGTNGGLAKYRADRGERPTRTMTAEALVCRQFLGMARGNPASNEAGDFILGELPGSGQPNYYYWYYATIGMFQLQGVYRDRWNSALTSTLLSSQRASGDEAGSWDPNDVWGGHGGRVYSTALGALCLEVYYRYLPLYGNTPLPEGGP
ncbi:MAG TPA: squalene--hopene cyclase, partial [Pirellulales bacterium]|nr:squalene--hopene cyclase [Pirellulales bacterium]